MNYDIQLKIIDSILTKNNCSQETIFNIKEYHREKLNKIQFFNKKRWHINYLMWKNIYCYGGNHINFINFHNLSNLGFINGPNQIGKSSILDILVLSLFNVQLRGHKEYIVNNRHSYGQFKISFNVGSTNYMLERLFYEKKSKHILLENKKDITKESLLETYKFIENKIGTYSNFISITASVQNNKLFPNLSQDDQLSKLCHFLGLNLLVSIENDVIKKLRSIELKKRNTFINDKNAK